MTDSLKSFYDTAIKSFDALRLFVHGAAKNDTEYEASISGEGATLREVIQYRAPQAWGELIRSRDGIALTVIPHMIKAPDFVARRLTFGRKHYENAAIMAAPTDDYLSNDGRDYAIAFAKTFASRYNGSRLTAFEHRGQHLLAIEKTQNSREAEENAWQLGREIARNIGNDRCLIKYPSLDVPADTKILGLSESLDSHTASVFSKLKQTTQHLPNVLCLNRVNDEYPATYSVSPLAFTVAPDENTTLARALAIGAEARAAVMNGTPDILQRHYTVVTVDGKNFENDAAAHEAASQALFEDWIRVMPGIPAPEVAGRATIKRDTSSNSMEIRLQIFADSDAVAQYHSRGQFRLELL